LATNLELHNPKTPLIGAQGLLLKFSLWVRYCSPDTQPALSVDAKEICSLLEQAVLRYFPQPIVDLDNFCLSATATTVRSSILSEAINNYFWFEILSWNIFSD
jgi:hypothetical protein